MATGSPPARSRAHKAWRRRNRSCVSWPTVSWTRKRAGAEARMTGRRAGAGRERTSGSPARAHLARCPKNLSLLTGAVADPSWGLRFAEWASGAGVTGVSSWVGPGVVRRRITGFASGFGARRATSDSISGLARRRAAARTSAWFSTVRWRASMRTAVRVTEPSASRSRIAGKRAARARGLDPGSGGVFGQAQGAGAIREERPVSFRGVHGAPRVELAEVGEQLDERRAFIARDVLEPRQEVPIRKRGCGGGRKRSSS